MFKKIGIAVLLFFVVSSVSIAQDTRDYILWNNLTTALDQEWAKMMKWSICVGLLEAYFADTASLIGEAKAQHIDDSVINILSNIADTQMDIFNRKLSPETLVPSIDAFFANPANKSKGFADALVAAYVHALFPKL